MGVMIFAKHPCPDVSIALISIVGILCVVIMSRGVDPVFSFLVVDPNRGNFATVFPGRLRALVKSSFVFHVYRLERDLHTSLHLFALFNIKERVKRLPYHHRRICRRFTTIMINVKKKIINPLE